MLDLLKPATAAVFTATGTTAFIKVESSVLSGLDYDVCFDPQTAGGLLFSLPSEGGASAAAMRQAGITDAVVGPGDVVSDDPGKILME